MFQHLSSKSNTMLRFISSVVLLFSMTVELVAQDKLQLVVTTSGAWGDHLLTEGLNLVQSQEQLVWQQFWNEYSNKGSQPLKKAEFVKFIGKLKSEIEDHNTRNRNSKSDGVFLFSFIENDKLSWVGRLELDDVMTSLDSSRTAKEVFTNIINSEGAATAGRLRSYLLSAFPDSERARGFDPERPASFGERD